MKRIVSILAALVLVLVLAAPGGAAWTITQKRSQFRTDLAEWVIVTMTCTSDASGTDTEVDYDVTGYYLYAVQTSPGTGGDVPTGVYTLDVEDGLDFALLETVDRSTTAIELVSGHITLGIFPPIKDTPSVVMSTLGDTNKTTVLLYFVR